jgi:hypothetical protein
MNGEQEYYVLVSEDDESCLSLAVTPKPIEYKWDDGAYICAILFTRDGCSFVISGKGFQPNESLIITSKTCEECITQSPKATADGKFISLLFPAVVGVEGASASYSISREQSGEEGMLNYLWGTSAQKSTK